MTAVLMMAGAKNPTYGAAILHKYGHGGEYKTSTYTHHGQYLTTLHERETW